MEKIREREHMGEGGTPFFADEKSRKQKFGKKEKERVPSTQKNWDFKSGIHSG